jgi:hypothetical protein
MQKQKQALTAPVFIRLTRLFADFYCLYDNPRRFLSVTAPTSEAGGFRGYADGEYSGSP